MTPRVAAKESAIDGSPEPASRGAWVDGRGKQSPSKWLDASSSAKPTGAMAESNMSGRNALPECSIGP